MLRSIVVTENILSLIKLQINQTHNFEHKLIKDVAMLSMKYGLHEEASQLFAILIE